MISRNGCWQWISDVGGKPTSSGGAHAGGWMLSGQAALCNVSCGLIRCTSSRQQQRQQQAAVVK